MSKKLICVLICALLAMTAFVGCGDGGSGDADVPAVDGGSGDAPSGGGDGEIYMFISQPEYADAINALIAEYGGVAPDVTVNYETTQNDYPTLLKAKLNSGDVPDIFSSTSGKEIDVYLEYSYDLSGQPLRDTMLDSVAEAMADGDGNGVYGLAIKGNYFGMIYNQQIFEDNNLTPPQTLSELREVCETLDAAGITPFTAGMNEWWVFKHVFQHFVGASTDNVPALIKQFEAGEAKIADYPLLYNNFFEFVDILTEYGDAKPLEADLSTEISSFASGQAAMISGQGAWVEADILKIDPEIRIGFMGYPVSDNAADCQVITGADQALRIYKDSAQLDTVLDFVNWWYTSDYGINWFTDVADVVPPVVVSTESDLAIIKQGNALVAENGSAPLGVIYSTDSFHTAFGEAMQGYVGGTADKDATCATIEAKWVELDGGDAAE